MKNRCYFENGVSINSRYLKKALNFDLFDRECRYLLFNFEIQYIRDLLKTDNFRILYFYNIDINHRVVHIVLLDKFYEECYNDSFVTLYLPFTKFCYQEKPYIIRKLVYVWQRQDNSIYEKTAPIDRPKVDRYNHYSKIEIGFVNKYGHRLIDIYELNTISDKNYSSITSAGLVLDR